MKFELREHTADVAVEAFGSTRDEVYAAVANGLAAAMCDTIPAGGERFSVSIRSENQEALLFDYLDELIYQRDVRDVLPVDNDARISGVNEGLTIVATARGVPLSIVNAREIKAVTYSDMAIEETDRGWRAYVVFDV